MSNNIVLAIVDPTTTEQPALRRAESLAVDTDAAIHAFCCEFLQDMTGFSSRKDAKHQTLNKAHAQLQTLAIPLRKENIRVTTEACWNQDWQQSAVEACSRQGASMLIKTISPHTPLARQLKSTSDFALLRNSHCPILLTHSGEPWQNRRILAAVALDNRDAAHEHLNNKIVAAAQRLARATDSDLHLVAALEISPDLTDLFRLLEDDEALESDAERVGRRFGVNPDRVHVYQGSARDIICDTAADICADLVVLGTVARRGLSATLLGNTAEQILDSLDIDMLVIPS